jgi:hypothetical protein
VCVPRIASGANSQSSNGASAASWVIKSRAYLGAQSFSPRKTASAEGSRKGSNHPYTEFSTGSVEDMYLSLLLVCLGQPAA